MAAFVVLYLKRAFRSRSLAALSEYLYGRLSPALLALPLWIFARFTLRQHKLFLKAGRIDAIDAEVAKESGDGALKRASVDRPRRKAREQRRTARTATRDRAS